MTSPGSSSTASGTRSSPPKGAPQGPGPSSSRPAPGWRRWPAPSPAPTPPPPRRSPGHPARSRTGCRFCIDAARGGAYRRRAMPQVRSRVRRAAPVSDSLQQIGERIRKARLESGLSQAQVGAPHFTRAYVSAIELGKVRPAMKSLEFLADKLRKPASYFLEDADADRRRGERAAVIARSSQLISEGKAAEAIEKARPLLESSESPAEPARLHL